MNDHDVIQQALVCLEELSAAYADQPHVTDAELRLEESLCETLARVRKASKVDNGFLIALEKFYQSTSLLVGLGGLKLAEPAYQAWRAYDHFHYDQVKTQLSLYGPTVMI